jgi:ATP-dependent Lon protease
LEIIVIGGIKERWIVAATTTIATDIFPQRRRPIVV